MITTSGSRPTEDPPAPVQSLQPSEASAPEAPQQDRPATALPAPRRLFVVAILAALLGFGITLSFGSPDHSPKPHGVRIAVAAPRAVSSGLAAGLERAEPGGFDAVRVSS